MTVALASAAMRVLVIVLGGFRHDENDFNTRGLE